MVDFIIPHWVKDKLLDSENVISKLSDRSRDYYATDRRLLSFTKKSRCDVLEYPDISITCKRRGYAFEVARVALILLGIFLAVFGLMGIILGPVYSLPIGDIHISFLEAFVILALGLLWVYSWASQNSKYYQIEGQGIGYTELKKWQIRGNLWSSKKVDAFAKVIQDRVGKVTK
jgi:Flp pilus assembly protein TadB